MTTTSEFARWGLVTSQADTNPQILVKKVDVRRRKVYSKEGLNMNLIYNKTGKDYGNGILNFAHRYPYHRFDCSSDSV